ncbi:Cmr1p KNAG_0C03850 [Huiozyma naganishii CBS 8797]|uniref:DNA damage-binding protein CMR1 n=1 Tax=Huiozyma naganishii (strain ATCC MYA-139 / BCRC 22969 / CBS 8797 / KCTC 17520 / NBRC 10181 / NCYC 3082 / Yp74L-3) TaxID=1071383 RepID=J7S4W1_HUIN7|nr:hypothetical protein KNAG_0C03850 [Kazachstania naganishii CBS 8797]CCK69489.1 hypothetical protein KNAG_0C03850 [Kazachstania naganishii CBS 8797]
MSTDESKLTSFQKKRLENIKRNNDLLKKLKLNSIIDLPKAENKLHKPKAAPKKKSVPKRKIEKEPSVPTRRSRRLQGQVAEKVDPNAIDLERPFKDEKKPFEDISIIGDIKLSDLVKDEDRLARLDSLKLSSGDFFNELKELQSQSTVKGADIDEFDSMKMVSSKVIYERVSSLYCHPDKDTNIVVAGDISGNLGIWKADLEQDEVEQTDDVTRFQLFRKNIGRIDCFPTETGKLLATSYDGFVRSVDLNQLESEEILQLKNEYDDALGVSDCQFSYEDPNVLFLVTLSGEFTTIDLREAKNTASVKFRRLADKKIGSMCINPKQPFQIATGSLDRTMRIWDIRKLVDKPEWSQYEDFPSHEVIATYDSRLSVSAVSYSPSDDTLVCNGYDDTIRLFDVSDKSLTEELHPKLTLKHNCQTGRWTSILKARFKPNKNIFAIANMSRAIDIYTSDGTQLAHMNTPTVPAVINWHPSKLWLAGGNSSGKVFLFSDQSCRVKQEVAS